MPPFRIPEPPALTCRDCSTCAFSTVENGGVMRCDTTTVGDQRESVFGWLHRAKFVGSLGRSSKACPGWQAAWDEEAA